MIARALLATAGLMLLWRGGRLVNAPAAMGGPGGFDLSNPLGALSIALGAALLLPLPHPWQRPGWALGGALAAIPALINLWRVPPFFDVTLSWYLGQPDPDVFGAGAPWTMLGLAPLAFALVAAGPPWPRQRGLLLGLAAAATLATCLAAQAFAEAPGAQARPMLLVACAPPIMVALLARRNPVARVAGAYALVLLALCLAILWLDHIAWDRRPLA